MGGTRRASLPHTNNLSKLMNPLRASLTKSMLQNSSQISRMHVPNCGTSLRHRMSDKRALQVFPLWRKMSAIRQLKKSWYAARVMAVDKERGEKRRSCDVREIGVVMLRLRYLLSNEHYKNSRPTQGDTK